MCNWVWVGPSYGITTFRYSSLEDYEVVGRFRVIAVSKVVAVVYTIIGQLAAVQMMFDIVIGLKLEEDITGRKQVENSLGYNLL